jgi:hypothetical protein
MLFASLEPRDVGFSYDERLSLDQNNVKMRDTYMRADEFIQPILRRLPQALLSEGFTCSDCPDPKTAAIRVVAWRDFVPYFTSYIWPDPVDTSGLEEGKKPNYYFHICSGGSKTACI